MKKLSLFIILICALFYKVNAQTSECLPSLPAGPGQSIGSGGGSSGSGSSNDCNDQPDDEFDPPSDDDFDEEDFSYDIIVPNDPNEIISPIGFDSARFVSINDNMAYIILYENEPVFATAPATDVFVYYPIHPKQQINSFRLGSFGFNDNIYQVPHDVSFYSARLDLVDKMGLYVDVTAGIDVVNNRAFWIFQSIDPATGLTPVDPFLGFLPIRDSTITQEVDTIPIDGQGYVTFYMKPTSSAQTRDTIFATAEIIFDSEASILTNTEFNTIDALPPASSVSLVSISGTEATLLISALDDLNGSGVRNYDLFMAQDSLVYNAIKINETDSLVTFIGVAGVQYHFFSLATDNTGNREALKSNPDLTIIFTDEENSPPVFTLNGVPVDTLSYVICVNDSVHQCVDATDPDLNPLTYSLIQSPLNGLVTLLTVTEGVCINYQPGVFTAPNDTLIVTVCDTENTCDTLYVFITLNNLPLAVITPNGPVDFCEGESVILTASGGDTYLWNTGETTHEIIVDTSGAYVVSVTNVNNCVSVTSETINVTPNVISSVTITNNTGNAVCSSTEVTFTANPVNGGANPSYNWTKNGLHVGSNSITYVDDAIQDGDEISCEITPDTLCSSSAQSNVILMSVTSTITWYADADGDGFGDPLNSISDCDQPLGYVSNNGDCDDTNPSINPAAIEICNGIDDNCDGLIDDADPLVVGQQNWFADDDGDGYGDPFHYMTTCFQPVGYVADNTDCDDTNPVVNPGTTEICGNGIDDNCDGQIDENCGTFTYYFDDDGDGYGDPLTFITTSDPTPPVGYVLDNTDCDDSNPAVNPGAAEICNGIDDNCSGLIDDADPSVIGQQIWYADADGDSYGNPAVSVIFCVKPVGYVDNDNDCDDTNALVNPGATEICGNGMDDNCDGQIDENCGTFTYYFDGDGDGYGDPLASITTSDPTPPVGYVTDNTDCDDTNPAVNPGATEVCNGIDDNCNGLIDDADPSVIGQMVWYADADGDGYGNPNVSIISCYQPLGYVDNNDDCDDTNVLVNPSAIEVCNGIDDNCNGLIDEGLIPQNPGNIQGPSAEACKNTIETYSVVSQPGITYTWTAPANATIQSGQGTPTVNVRFLSQFNSGVLSVVAGNICGTSAPSQLTITSLPPMPSGVSGPTTVCRFSQNSYSITAVPGANSYFWRVQSGGAQIVSGQGTLNAVVQFGRNGTNVQVRSENTCGSSAYASLPVATTVCIRTINETLEASAELLNIYPNPAGNTITISSAITGKVLIQIINVLGQQVFVQEIELSDETSPQIDISQMASGMYMITLQGDSGSAVGKFLKE